ncbi:TonB-dependent siderophore receptor [Muricoccus radiodurans]|uniref:TonB-dependent siderophore receptor n=1 Tax=Muricoccus radiodurans TaxID=2231721 RepID=UPI003CEA58C6
MMGFEPRVPRLLWLLSSVAFVVPAVAQTPPAATPGTALELPSVEVQSQAERALDQVRGFVANTEITGTKTDTPLIENPQSISVVPRDQIDARQAQTLGEALRYNAGVRTEVFGPDTRTDWLQIRGFDAQDNGIFLNGLRYNAGFAGSVYETYGLERYEILRGPASVLYGQIAPGGLINQVSRRPTQTPQGEVRLSAGSFDRLQAQGYSSGPLTANGVWSYSLTGLVRDSRTQVDSTRDDRYFIAPALTWRPTDNTRVTLLPYYQHDRTSGGQFLPYVGTVVPTPFGRISRDRFTGERAFDRYERDQWGIGYEIEHRFDSVWSVQQNFRYSHTGIDWRQVYGGGLTADQRSLNRFNYLADIDVDTVQVDNQVQARFSTGPLQHTVLAGFDYSRVNLRNTQFFNFAPSLDLFTPSYGSPLPALTTPFLNTRQTTSQYGLYAQDQIRFDRFLLTGSIRHDWVPSTLENRVAGTRTSQDDSALTGRVGLIYLAANGLAPYASYARSFQPQIGVNASAAPFDPLEGEQYEVGIKYQPPGINSFIQLSAFHLTQRNTLITDPNNTFFQAALGEIRVRGLELEGTASLTEGLSLVGNLTYLDPEITRGEPGQVGNRPPGVAKFTAGLYGDYTFREGSGPLSSLGLGLGVRYLGNTSASATSRAVVPSTTLFDAAVRYDLGQLTTSLKGFQAALNVSNLADTRYVGRCSSETACFYGTRRTVIGSLVYRW